MPVSINNSNLKKEKVEGEIGSELTWNDSVLEIYTRREVADLYDENVRPEQYAWLLEQLEKFYQVFSSRLKQLEDPEEASNEAPER